MEPITLFASLIGALVAATTLNAFRRLRFHTREMKELQRQAQRLEVAKLLRSEAGDQSLDPDLDANELLEALQRLHEARQRLGRVKGLDDEVRSKLASAQSRMRTPSDPL